MKKKMYGIIAGNPNRPQVMTAGRLEKGKALLQEGEQPFEVAAKRGDVGFPNYTEAWGIRLIDGEVPDSPVDVRDRKYKGEVKWLPWGDPRGHMITARYLKGYPTLDIQYQDLVLNARVREEDDVHYLSLHTGDNFFDPENDRWLVEMFRIHYLNKDSRSKSPEVDNSIFQEIKDDEFSSPDVRLLTFKGEALQVVQDAAEDHTYTRLRALRPIVDVHYSSVTVADKDLYAHLLHKADQDPEDFATRVQLYKRDVSNLFEKAKSYDVLDFSKDGSIVANVPKGKGMTKKEPVVDDIPAKGEDVLAWILTNFLDERSQTAISKLKQITDTLK